MLGNQIMINGVACDTFAYIDERRTRDTIIWPAEGRESYWLIAYLFADGKPFPVARSYPINAECYMTEDRNDPNAEVHKLVCLIGGDGEIKIPIASKYRIPDKVYYCEINIIGNAGEKDEFRFKSSNFRLAFIE